MSLKIGGSASKSTTTQHSTTTPILPDWATSATKSAAGRVEGLLQQNPSDFVGGANALQLQAANGAGGLGDSSWLDPRLSSATPFSSGGKAYNYVDKYLDPYLTNVVDATAADMDAHAGQVRAQQALDLAGSGAFGGSGAALTRSMTEGELARARATSLSGLRSQGYAQALTAAAGDADRATQARIANAQAALQDWQQKVNAGFEKDENQRANSTTQMQLGTGLRGVDNEVRQAPITTSAQIISMLSGVPLGLFAGEQKDSKTKTKEFKVEGSAEKSFG